MFDRRYGDADPDANLEPFVKYATYNNSPPEDNHWQPGRLRGRLLQCKIPSDGSEEPDTDTPTAHCSRQALS
jgi:hypothetical protein